MNKGKVKQKKEISLQFLKAFQKWGKYKLYGTPKKS